MVEVVAVPLQAPIALEYAARRMSAGPPRWVRVCLLLGSCIAAATFFLPFTWRVSPAEVVWDFVSQTGTSFLGIWTLVLMATPFFLGLLLVAWHARLTIREPATNAERVVMSVAAVASLGMSAWLFVAVVSGTSVRGEQVAVLVATLVALLGLASMLFCWRRLRSADLSITVLAEGAYLTNATFCLIIFEERPDFGWWITLVAGLLMLVEMGMNLVRAIALKAGQGR